MRLFVILISLLHFSANTQAQECHSENNSFSFGERVDYEIYYYLGGVWLSAGEVYFKVDSARVNQALYYHFDSYGSTFRKYDWIYKVRDRYQAYASLNPIKPYRFKREVNEGETFIYEYYAFNHDSNKVISSRKFAKKDPIVKDTVALPGDCNYDVLTMIYHARNIDFSKAEVDDLLPIRIFIDNASHESHIRYLGKQELKVKGLGTFRCIVFSPLLIEGTIFNAGEGMTVWVSDDENKVPLLVETPILVGSIKARVNKMEGLKHPLKSKLAD